MAHQSGYGGSIEWDGNSVSAPSWNLTIKSWNLRYAQRQHETPVMGAALRAAAWPLVTLGMAEWTADVVYLISRGLATGNLAIGLEVTIHLRMNDDPDFFFGTGITSIGTVDVPLDGPIEGTMAIKGISQLAHSAT